MCGGESVVAVGICSQANATKNTGLGRGTEADREQTHLILLPAARNFVNVLINGKHPTGSPMKLVIAAAALSVSVATANAASISPAPRSDRLHSCTARVLYSEELPFAPEGKWLVNVTLEITPPNGNAYAMTLHDWMPWQGPPPRRGQAFRLLCDPARPYDLHLPPRA